MVTIVIADFEMPVMNGLEAIREIRAFYSTINQRLRKKMLIQQSSELISTQSVKSLTMPKFVMFSVHTKKGFLDYVMERGVN